MAGVECGACGGGVSVGVERGDVRVGVAEPAADEDDHRAVGYYHRRYHGQRRERGVQHVIASSAVIAA